VVGTATPCVTRTFCSLPTATTRLDLAWGQTGRDLAVLGRRRAGQPLLRADPGFSFCIPVGSQAPQAVGVAYAFKLRKEPRVAVLSVR